MLSRKVGRKGQHLVLASEETQRPSMEDSGRRRKRKREQDCPFRERFFSKDLQYIFQGLRQNRSVRLLDQNPAER